ncbi:S-adenosyl-L-methionine-dependent methyltransferase superfamily protein [Zea mays]|uniref:S-adenosyl-L-methionine-dependent methyltransferase superfamily protein n=4 Tax=Zea mays TaxID=4577 RepID=A0A1D6I6C6_MAIZE|nr:S-adenosyl-L-methionine-dependent methyltransferase superfamily protein [Zea mays]
MGGGRKRGRTQRRHFKQGRENVWKHNPQRPPAGEGGEAREDNPSWQPFATENPAFEEYYKEQQIVSEEEWDSFMSMLRKPLPATFRINASCQFFQDICSQLENDFRKSLETEVTDDHEEDAIRPLPWYPGNLAWHLNFSRMQLRRNQALESGIIDSSTLTFLLLSFHEFLKRENEVGNITRQEAVSMVPPLFLNVQPDHHILDMCAAPGSKTFQLLEMIHQSTKPGLLPNALVVANDVDVQRCNLLIHQTKRMCTANLIVTNHEAQNFPGCNLAKFCSKMCMDEAKVQRLEFDRVLCDVPCSGDGTVRKAPDMWRKWNAGMGNGLHHLQVEIAMRGMSLLKVGGRMVYSTCSMNPVENEGVVAEILRRCGDSVELLDVSNELPELARRPGLSTWKVRDRGSWFGVHEDVPRYRKHVISASMFPSGKGSKDSGTGSSSVEVNTDVADADMKDSTDMGEGEQETTVTIDDSNNGDNLKTEEGTKVDCESGEVTTSSSYKKLNSTSIRTEHSDYPLHRCMRIVPHDQNSGAFFIAVLHKLSPLNENQVVDGVRIDQNISKDKTEKLEKDLVSHKASSEENTVHQQVIDNANVLDGEQNRDRDNKSSEDKSSEDSKVNVNEAAKGQAGTRDRRRQQNQGRWRGVDPVIFFKDEVTVKSIVSFYGITDSFPLEGHLVTRNPDTSHVKRIYYVSKSVQDVLELNIKIGERLKITSLGLKIFERQSSKEGSPCTFRLSSEGLPLLLPYITKQILYASAIDFQHLLQYRTIKFPDFVDAKFGEEASALLPGCCVVVLREGHQDIGSIATDPSAIAIVCWKGKTNLCVMVSPLDGKELLERISLRHGLKIPKGDKEKPSQEIAGSDELLDCATEVDDQESLPESKASDIEISDAKEAE